MAVVISEHKVKESLYHWKAFRVLHDDLESFFSVGCAHVADGTHAR